MSSALGHSFINLVSGVLANTSIMIQCGTSLPVKSTCASNKYPVVSSLVPNSAYIDSYSGVAGRITELRVTKGYVL